jgi:hypothetical protein
MPSEHCGLVVARSSCVVAGRRSTSNSAAQLPQAISQVVRDTHHWQELLQALLRLR